MSAIHSTAPAPGPRVITFPGADTPAPPRKGVRIKRRVRDNWIKAAQLRLVRAEADRLLADLQRDRDRHGQPGWRQAVAVTCFLAVAPFRADCAARLVWDDVTEEDGWAFISALDKGGRETEKEIDPATWTWLRALLVSLLPAGATVSADTPLLGPGLNDDLVSNRVGRCTYQLIGLRPSGKRYTAHSLRHTFACNGLLRGVDSALLAKQLGHSIETFLTYYAELPTKCGVTIGIF